MKAQLGIPIGLALALLSTLLATFFAMGVFPVAQAQTPPHSASRSFSEDTVAPGGEVVVTIDVSGYGNFGSVEETLPAGFSYVSTSGGPLVTERDNQLVEFLLVGNVDSFTYTVTASDTEGTYTFNGEFVTRVDRVDVPVDIGGESTVTVDAGATDGNGDGTGITLSSKTAGAAVQVVIKASADTAKTSANDITVNLAKFGVPTSIPERAVIIADDSRVDHTDGDARYIGEPGSITVSGTKVTLSLYARFPGSSSDTAGTLEDGYTITFKQSAGITNPAIAGTATVTVGDGDDDSHSLKETIQSVVSLSKGSGARGTEVTVKGVGLGKGGATVYLVQDDDDDISLGTGNVGADGKVEVDIETSSDDFMAGVEAVDENGDPVGERDFVSTDSLRGLNRITIVDGTGTTVDKMARFTVTPTIDVDEDAVQQGDELTIIVEDWYYSGVSSVTIGDEIGRIVDDGDNAGDFEVDIIVPPSARLGEQELKVTGRSTDKEGSLTAGKLDVAKGTIVIGALAIEVEPSSFVLGQQFTINVKGFSTDDPVRVDGDVPDDIKLVKVGNYLLKETTAGVGVERLSIDTNGFFTNTFRLNSNDQYLKPGGYRVQVEDHSGRVALGRITIPEPTITVDPSISRRGTTVSIAGENFPAGRVVQIYYRDTEDENQQGAVLADSAGRISISFTVPSDAEIGEEQDVTATSAAKETDYKAKATHSLPPQEITVTPMQVAPGGRLTIEGHNMPLYTLVGLKIADISVAGTGAETDDLGSFVKEDVLVPQLKPGTHTVEASVATQGAEAAKVRTTIEIVEALTTGAPADVFDPLGDRLVRVWYLERATQVWSFYDPDPDVAAFNTLTEVSSGQNVSIIISSGESVEFQGMPLYQGTNPIALN